MNAVLDIENWRSFNKMLSTSHQTYRTLIRKVQERRVWNWGWKNHSVYFCNF